MPSNKKPRFEGKAGLMEKHIKLIFMLKAQLFGQFAQMLKCTPL